MDKKEEENKQRDLSNKTWEEQDRKTERETEYTYDFKRRKEKKEKEKKKHMALLISKRKTYLL